MFCPNCGSPSNPNDAFCKRCGHPLRAASATQQTAFAPEEAASAQERDVARPDVSPAAQDRSAAQDREREPAAPTTAPAPSPAPKGRVRPAVMALSAACVVLVVAIVAVVVATRPTQQVTDSPSDPAATQAASTTGGTIVDPVTGEQVSALDRPLFAALARESALAEAAPQAPQVAGYTIEPGLSNVTNVNDTYLSDEAKTALERYGFVVDARYGHDEFYEVYEMNRYDLFPNFVTVDSLMHTYHLYFQHLQKNTERDHLASTVLGMSQELLDASTQQLEALTGTEWEQAARRNVAFFAVGATLQDPSTQVPAQVASSVAAEVQAINDASGMATSAVTGDDEDYTQYKPRGYYEGDAALEAYFRTMMWYGRMNFKQSDEDLDRSALLMTLALQGDALDRWQAVYAVTSFFVGASDDCGYYEYQPLLEAAYGAGASVDDLAGNDEAWQHFHALTELMPAPQINSVPLGADDDPNQSRTDAEKGYRLMGQRFTLDEMVFAQLVYPNSGKDSSGAGRMLPDALDVPAALGSDAALAIAEDRGAARYQNYEANMAELREQLSSEDDPRWFASLYSQWLYTLNPLLGAKGEGYPTFMQTDQWQRKSLQTYLGSYTELKHDTVLYAKQIMAEMGGGPLEERDDRGYVEPEPEVFGRLATLVQATSEGLAGYSLLGEEDEQNLALLQDLANRLATIAQKELSGDAIGDDEYDLIRTYGGQLEHFWQEVYKNETDKEYFTSRDFPSALVVDVATNGDDGTVLELGTGRAMTVYAVVPVEGSLRIASGSVFSFYQFEQPMSNRLTDSEWRAMMGIELGSDGQYHEPGKQPEDWTHDFSVLE